VRSSTLASRIARLALTKKGYDIVTMDLRGLTSMADFFVVCSADSDIQARAIADAVDDGMRGAGHAPWHRETGSAQWILLDFVDVVLHIFHKNTRSFYNLEKLWGDAPVKRTEDTPAPPAKGTRTKKTATARKPRTQKKTRSTR
jgi:ribosome-associated protein